MKYLPLQICCILFSFSLLAQPDTTVEGIRIPVWDTVVLFNSDQAVITDQADTTLNTVSRLWFENSPALIEITAHTDNVGSAAHNEILSQKRALAVKTFLVGTGIPDSSIQLMALGESAPATENTTESGRQANRRASIQITRILPATLLDGVITDGESGAGIPSDIMIHGLLWQDSFQTDSAGAFSRMVPKDAILVMDVHAPGYFFESKRIKTHGHTLPKLEVRLPKVKKGESVEIDNLYFLGDQAVLVPGAERELPKIVKFMQLNKAIQIEIAGHINLPNQPPADTSTFHYKLSVNRAKFLYDYLLDKGISADRMQFKGYGNSQMKYPKATTEKLMRLNRRVEIKVLETGETISEEKKPEKD